MNQKKILKIAAVFTLAAAVITVIISLSTGQIQRRGGIDVLMRALDNNGDATCVITPPDIDDDENSSLLVSQTIEVSENDARITYEYFDAEFDNWQSNELLRDGFLYKWESSSPRGAFEELNITAQEYLDGINVFFEDEDSDFEVQCEQGISQPLEFPDDVIFDIDRTEQEF